MSKVSLIFAFITLSLVNVFVSCNMQAQNPSRGGNYIPPPPPFMPNEAQLNELVEALTCVLNGNENMQKLQNYFFDQALAEEYTGFLEGIKAPEITKRTAPAFVQMSETVRQYIIKNAGNIKTVKVMTTRQRYGVNEQMKIVAPTIHLTYKNDMLEQIKLQLIDYDGYYRILSFDE